MIFNPSPRLVASIAAPPPFAIAKVADEALFFIQWAALAKLVGNIHKNPTQNLVSVATLKAATNGFYTSDNTAVACAIARRC
jgi:hypothetical protein